MTAITKRRHAELAGQALKYVAELVLIEPLSPAFDHKLEGIEALGRDAIAQVSARHAGSLVHVSPPSTDGIARGIAAMRALAQSLDPLRPGNPEGNLAQGARRLGLFAAKPDPAAYFRRYRSAQSEIEAALCALTRERDGLIRANVDLEAQAAALQPLLAALSEHALFADEVALTITARAEALALREPMRARRLQSDALHVVRTRARDLAEARAIAQQAHAMHTMISDTNARLIAAIEQTTASMAQLLRTATEAARLLAQQELVLDAITSLGRAASNLITADDPDTHRDSAQHLQSAFARLYDALDRLDAERTASPSRIAAPPS